MGFNTAKNRIAGLVLIFIAMAATGCGRGFAVEQVASDVQGDLACKSARSDIFDSYYNAYGSKGEVSVSELTVKSESELPKTVKPEMRKSVKAINDIMTNDIAALLGRAQAKAMNKSDPDAAEAVDPLLHLIRLEMKSELDPQYAAINAKLDAAIEEGRVQAEAAGVECETPIEAPLAVATPVPSVGRMPAVAKAARFTMATAYQSCRSVQLPPLTASDANIQGVKKAFMVDSVGWAREYTDVALLKRTDPYLRGETYGPSCINQDKKPLVYDYGGAPVIKSDSSLSMFENSGGGSALGVDCSAFISTAAGVAGHRYKPGAANKPVYTRFASRDFINPATSGWTCYESVKPTKTLTIQPGDIASVVGHVVMIDSVGADPFGIASARTADDCNALSTSRFDFTLIQSSSSKDSIGINRFVAKDFLAEGSHSVMTTLFNAYAKAACLTKLDGIARDAKASNYGMIRHKTDSNCMAPALQLVGQSCVANCSL